MEFQNYHDSGHGAMDDMLPLIPMHQTPLKVLAGFIQYDCHRGPERNSWGKQKYKEKVEAAQNVNHISAVGCKYALF